jgi:hypothetical protein
MEAVSSKITKIVTDHHHSLIKAEYDTFLVTIETLEKLVKKNELHNYKQKLIELRENMFDRKHFFFPHTFGNSIGYNESVIVYLAHFAETYMAVSCEVELFYAKQGLPKDGEFASMMTERQWFLTNVTKEAEHAMIWALDKRIDHIKSVPCGASLCPRDELTETTGSNRYVSAWTKFGLRFNFDLGPYWFMAHDLRYESQKVIEQFVYEPINKLLVRGSLPLIKPFTDKKVDYARTIYNKPCHTPCVEHEKKYWWCGAKIENTVNWEYCSPVGPVQKTIYGKICDSVCKTSGSYFWCKVSNSWDYCSPNPIEKIKEIRWPNHERSITSTLPLSICKNSCEKRGESYYWCNTIDDSWDYCSPQGEIQSSYKNNICRGPCKQYKGVTWSNKYYVCKTDFEDNEYCSFTYKKTISPPGDCYSLRTEEKPVFSFTSDGVCITLDYEPGDLIKENHDWFYAYHISESLKSRLVAIY